jgi:hypothetical protein
MSFKSSSENGHFVTVSSPSGGSNSSSGNSDSSDESSGSVHQVFSNSDSAFNNYMLNEIVSRVAAASAAIASSCSPIESVKMHGGSFNSMNHQHHHRGGPSSPYGLVRPQASYALSGRAVEVGGGGFVVSNKHMPIQKRILIDYWPHEKENNYNQHQSACHRSSNSGEEDAAFVAKEFEQRAGFDVAVVARRQDSYGSEATSKHYSGNHKERNKHYAQTLDIYLHA